MLVVQVGPGEVLHIMKEKGMRVRESDTLAVREMPTGPEGQVALNRRKSTWARAHALAALRDLDRAVAVAAAANRCDSLAYENARELVEQGFGSPAALAALGLRRERSASALGKLRSSRPAIEARCAIDVARLDLSSAQARARGALRAARAVVIAPCAGTLLDITREFPGGKEKVVFVIGELRP
jgi:hypothetical protein